MNRAPVRPAGARIGGMSHKPGTDNTRKDKFSRNSSITSTYLTRKEGLSPFGSAHSDLGLRR